MPLSSIHDWYRFEDKYAVVGPSLEDTEIEHLLSTHTLSPLIELYVLSDPNRIKDINSTTMEYISTFEDQKPKFKKVATPTDVSYSVEGVGFFEKLSSNVHRHMGRMNGENLLLVETCLYYDVLPKQDGNEIISAYKDNIHRIPNGDITSVYDEIFPKYILCNKTQVLKLRKTRKILQLPDFKANSKEEKYSRVLLFYPLRPGQNIDTDRLGLYFHF